VLCAPVPAVNLGVVKQGNAAQTGQFGLGELGEQMDMSRNLQPEARTACCHSIPADTAICCRLLQIVHVLVCGPHSPAVNHTVHACPACRVLSALHWLSQ
jgi:hypothetical protein